MKCLCCGKNFMPKSATQKYCCRKCGRRYIRTVRKKTVEPLISYENQIVEYTVEELKSKVERLDNEIKALKRDNIKLKAVIFCINELTEKQIAGGGKCN